MAIVLLIIAVICAVNWLKWKVSTMAMLYYMEKKGCKLPTDEESKACSEYAIKKMFGVN